MQPGIFKEKQKVGKTQMAAENPKYKQRQFEENLQGIQKSNVNARNTAKAEMRYRSTKIPVCDQVERVTWNKSAKQRGEWVGGRCTLTARGAPEVWARAMELLGPLLLPPTSISGITDDF